MAAAVFQVEVAEEVAGVVGKWKIRSFLPLFLGPKLHRPKCLCYSLSTTLILL